MMADISTKIQDKLEDELQKCLFLQILSKPWPVLKQMSSRNRTFGTLSTNFITILADRKEKLMRKNIVHRRKEKLKENTIHLPTSISIGSTENIPKTQNDPIENIGTVRENVFPEKLWYYFCDLEFPWKNGIFSKRWVFLPLQTMPNVAKKVRILLW